MQDSKQQIAAEADRPEGVSNTPVKWKRDMNVCIDYLRVTFAGTFFYERYGCGEYQKLIDAFKVLDDQPITPEGGKGGYARTYSFGESMMIFAGGKHTKNSHGEETFSIEIKGQGCREFEDRVTFLHFDDGEEGVNKAIHDAWLHLFVTIAEYRGTCTRLDLPTDDFSGLIPIDELKDKLVHHVYASSIRKKRRHKPGEEGNEEDCGDNGALDETDDGWSFTIGGRNTCQLCIYNKLIEQKEKTHALFNTDYWIRYEVRYYHDAAVTALAKLTTAYQHPDHQEVVRMIVGCLKDKLDIKERKSKHTRKEKTWSKWAEFMKEAMDIHIVAQKRPESTIESNAAWLLEDTTKCLGKIAGVLHKDMISAVLYLLYEGIGKVEDEEIHIINAHLIREGLPGYSSVREYREKMAEELGTGTYISDEVKKLFVHEVFKLGSARYTSDEPKPEEPKDKKEGD